MFDAYQLSGDPDAHRRLLGAAGLALVLLASAALVAAWLTGRAAAEPVRPPEAEVSFRPPPPPPVKLAEPPPPPALPKRAKPVVQKAVAVAPAPAPAPLVQPKEAPVAPPPEAADAEAVAGAELAVGGTGTGLPAEPALDESPAPVVSASGPINLPEEADPPEPSEDNAPPDYPEVARASGLEARVVLKVVIQADGTVGRVQVLKGEEPFVAAARAAVEGWTYEPARLDGEAIAVFKIVDLKFKLRE